MRSKFALPLMMAVVTGCTTYPQHRIPEVGVSSPASQSGGVDASYKFTGGECLSPAPRGYYHWFLLTSREREFCAALKTSGCFSSLTPGQGGSVHIDADILDQQSLLGTLGRGVVGGLSLFTIPTWATDVFELRATVTTARGAQREYVLDDAMTTIIWLPMIVAAPFNNPVNTSADLRENLYRTLTVRMQRDGLLPSARN